MAGRPVQQLDAAAERQLAVDLFNHVWTLMDLPSRTPAQDAEMIHAAHASRHHWGVIGEPVNWARGEWQVSRVYCVLGRGEPALYHAGRCLELCRRARHRRLRPRLCARGAGPCPAHPR
jgi:hypothetical protein